MANPCRSKTARTWLTVHEHKDRAKQIEANLLTDPGMYRTTARKKQQRHIQTRRADRITELRESTAGMATYGANKVLELPRMGKR